MRILFIIVVGFWVSTAAAQTNDDDRDFITGLIEDTISNDDMTVRLENFQGALRSAATADAITLSDPDGVWLRLEGLTIEWTRSALLSGRVEIETLAAERIELLRLPAPSDTADLPSAAATPFELPDLPVSVEIAAVTASEIVLTEALLGEPIIARFSGALTLKDGVGDAAFLLQRTDSTTGLFDVDARYENDTRTLALDLRAEEGENGIAARLLSVPDRPSVRLSITGDDPLDDFVGTIALATNGVERVTGTARLSRPTGTMDQAFALNLTGDLRPLLADSYDPFFGANTVLRVNGTQFAQAGLALSDLTLATDQVVLRGAARFDAQGWPEAIDLRGRLGTGGQTRVLLPLGDTPTEVSGMALNVTYDAAVSDAWTGVFDITSLTRDGLSIDALALSGGGTIVPGAGGAVGRFSADLDYAARGLDLNDDALNAAVGADIDGTIDLSRVEADAFVINDITVTGAGLFAQANAIIQGPDERFATRADLSVEADDFARFAEIAQLDLSGDGKVNLSGDFQPFDGIFDITLDARTTDLAFGIAEIDPVLAGDARVFVQADRDTTGTRLRSVDITATGVTATGSGAITDTTASAIFYAQIDDLARIAQDLSGPATLQADVSTDAQGVVSLQTDVTAPRVRASFGGTATPQATGYLVRGLGDASVTDLSPYGRLIGQPLGGGVSLDLDGRFLTATSELSAAVVARTQDIRVGSDIADSILRGSGRVSADVALSEAGRLRLDALDVAFPNLSANGQVATSGNDTTADLSLRLRDVALLVSDISGPLVADITARQDSAGWQVTGDATGPVNTNAQLSGRVSTGGDLNLSVTGSAPLDLANLYIAPRQASGLLSFDLAVQGPPALSSVRGPVRISNARITAPALRQALEDLNGTILLAGGTARLDLRGTSAAGGDLTLSGPVDLSPPFQAGLIAGLENIVIEDPELYRTSALGQIAVMGPLAGGASIAGQIDLGTVDVQVPSTGVSALGSLPDVTHLGVPTDVRATLERANIGVTPPARTASSGGPDYPIDLLVRAPARIFVRGRGLDAELGGQLRLTGSTANIQPIGRFDLARGRLNILGQRFELDEGFAQLQGDFTPFLRLVATTETQSGTIVRIIVEGPADDIEVRFESSPERPQDEVLSQLLFGRDLSSITPLQAVQLASAVATLAGNGSGGFVNNLREGLDLDQLDLVTDETGGAAVRAGKYLSENIYTDVTIGSGGTSEINLNIDISPSVTARGSVASDGETSVGIFFERDY